MTLNAVKPLILNSSIRDCRHSEVHELSDNISRLKRLGFAKGNQLKLFGEVFEVVGEPILMADEVVLLDATDHG